MSLLQLEREGFGKEGMIAIPLPLAIQRDDKQISSLKVLKHELTVLLLHDSITEGRVESFQDGGREQKRLDLSWLLLQNHLGQVVQDVALLSADLLEQEERIGLLGQGKREHLQAHQPALGTYGHLLQDLIWQLDAHDVLAEGFWSPPRYNATAPCGSPKSDHMPATMAAVEEDQHV